MQLKVYESPSSYFLHLAAVLILDKEKTTESLLIFPMFHFQYSIVVLII